MRNSWCQVVHKSENNTVEVSLKIYSQQIFNYLKRKLCIVCIRSYEFTFKKKAFWQNTDRNIRNWLECMKRVFVIKQVKKIWLLLQNLVLCKIATYYSSLSC